MLENLGPLDEGRFADLRVHLGAVADPRSRRGRWYPLTAILLMCACAAVSGARSIEEVAEFGQRACRSVLAALGMRPRRRQNTPWRGSAPARCTRRSSAASAPALSSRKGWRAPRRAGNTPHSTREARPAS
ncbi:transposase family protein [Streptomyces gelaticus]